MFFAKPKAGVPGIFLNGNFNLFFSGRIVSQLGDQIYTFAISWYILTLTQSSLQMTVPLLLTTIITAVVSLFGGTIADRINRKRILVNTDIIQGAVLVVMAVLASIGSLPIWAIYLFTAVLAFCAAIFSPSASAIIPDIVLPTQMEQAMSANQFTISLCTMAGMLFGGVLFQILGITAVLAINAASFFASAILEGLLKVPAKQRNREKLHIGKSIQQTLHEFADGYKHVQANKPVFRYLWVSSIFHIFSLPVGMVFIPYFFNVVLKSSAVELAVPQACVWLGMIGATIFIPLAMRKNPLPRLISRSLVWMALCTLAGAPLVFFFSQNWLDVGQLTVIWTVVNLIVGFSVNLFMVPLFTFYQIQSTDEFRGRFWGIENSLRTAALGCGYLLAGLLAQNFSLLFLFAIYAILMFPVAAWARNILPETKKSPAPIPASDELDS